MNQLMTKVFVEQPLASPGSAKNCMVCIFAVILIFLLPSNHVVDKMSVSHANEIWKYIMNLILFQITDFLFS